jgi:hypothetical protein
MYSKKVCKYAEYLNRLFFFINSVDGMIHKYLVYKNFMNFEKDYCLNRIRNAIKHMIENCSIEQNYQRFIVKYQGDNDFK